MKQFFPANPADLRVALVVNPDFNRADAFDQHVFKGKAALLVEPGQVVGVDQHFGCHVCRVFRVRVARQGARVGPEPLLKADHRVNLALHPVADERGLLACGKRTALLVGQLVVIVIVPVGLGFGAGLGCQVNGVFRHDAQLL